MTNRGKNLSSVRKHNQKLVLRLLQNQPYCCNDLAKMTDLCNSGVEKIVDNLEAIGLIRVCESREKKTVGRAPIFYSLNGGFGYVLAVDLTSSEFVVSDICGERLLRESFAELCFSAEGHHYDLETFRRIISGIEGSLSKHGLARELLLSVCVATFGKVNVETGAYEKVMSVDDFEKVNLKELFSAAFPGIPVLVENDNNVAAFAEEQYGKLRGCTDNSLFVRIDEGISCAMFFDGKLVRGTHFLGGEIGYNHIYSRFSRQEMRLGDCVTFYSLRNRIRREYQAVGKHEDILLEGIIPAFRSGDALVRALVFDSAEMLGTALFNFTDMLDCRRIVIAGEVVKFGSEYLERIRCRKDRLIAEIDAEFSSILEDNVLLGAKFLAVENAIDYSLRQEL